MADNSVTSNFKKAITSPFSRKQEVWGETYREPYGANTEETLQPSSRVSDINYQGYKYVIRPDIEFNVAYDFYSTIGKVQNVIDAFVSEVMSRDWYFEDVEEKKKPKSPLGKTEVNDNPKVKAAVKWADKFLSRVLEYMVRDWLICGNSIIGTTDWEPVQMNTVVGMKRDEYGRPIEYVYSVNGKWEKLLLPLDEYIHTKYIEINRRPWGIGLFHSLMTTFSWQGSSSLPILEIYRRHLQNLAKIEERYASPMTVWAYENITKDAYDQQRDALKAMKPGDRRVTNRLPTLLTETIDARGGLIAAITPIMDGELESGLQSSAIRLITDPSAMADAREANKKDDSRVLGIMERIRRVMNKQILPIVMDDEETTVQFVWGSQDDLELDPATVKMYVDLGALSALEAREILKRSGVFTDDALYAREKEEKDLENQKRFDQNMQMADKKSGFEKDKIDAVNAIKKKANG